MELMEDMAMATLPLNADLMAGVGPSIGASFARRRLYVSVPTTADPA